jgi:hypothetical protein
MADCIKARLEAAETTPVEQPMSGPAEASPPSSPVPPVQAQVAKPVNALSLLWSVIVARLRRLFGGRAAQPR